MEKSVRLGINIGNTHTYVAVYRGTQLIPLVGRKHPDGVRTVFYDDNITKTVGIDALLAAESEPVFLAEDIIDKLDKNVLLDTNDTKYSPKEVLTEIFRHVLGRAEAFLRYNMLLSFEDIEVVISVPDGISAEHALMIKAACEEVQTMLERNVIVLDIIPASVACAMGYADNHDVANENIAVFDLGGTRFASTIVKAGEDTSKPYTVEDRIVDDRLGGFDWDVCVENWLLGKYRAEINNKITDFVQGRMKFEGPIVKEMLTTQDSAIIEMDAKEDHYKFEITREEFEKASEEPRKRVSDYLFPFIEKNADKDIKNLIVAGGATRMPQIRRMIEESDKLSGMNIFFEGSDHLAARGATVYARDFK